MRKDADYMIERCIRENLPGPAVRRALEEHPLGERVHVLAIGKAAWAMAEEALGQLGGRAISALVITKHGHSAGQLPGCEIIEAGHPIPDENTLIAGNRAVALAEALGEGDELLLLLSGGGSALFEKPLPSVSYEDLADVTFQLISSGADIVKINAVRKRLSAIKGGRFAALCAPAQVYCVALSDVLGDRLDAIASGPAAVDPTTTREVAEIVDRYHLKLSDAAMAALGADLPRELPNVHSVVTGGVRTLCRSAAEAAEELGYTPYVLSAGIEAEAREAGGMLACMARDAGGPQGLPRPCAIIMGGETVVHIKGDGKGGRNQELALAAAMGIDGVEDTLIFSFGSDGTDGPTDAAGGIVDGGTAEAMRRAGISPIEALERNDSYNALRAADALIMTGPTGTNVNDVMVALCR